MQVALSQHASPFGTVSIGMIGDKICYAEVGANGPVSEERMLSQLPKETIFTPATKEQEKKAEALLKRWLSGEELPLSTYALHGTTFQRKVWEKLCSIPRGEVITYSTLAARAGNPAAIRAAGTACGKNPVSLFVPCHRVIASNGTLGGYGWGLPLKQRLLDWEAKSASKKAA